MPKLVKRLCKILKESTPLLKPRAYTTAEAKPDLQTLIQNGSMPDVSRQTVIFADDGQQAEIVRVLQSSGMQN